MTSSQLPNADSPPGLVTRRLLFHVHTYRSFDSLLRPRRILEYARAQSLDAVIVCDHSTHLGAVDCREATREDDPDFPIAAEYKSTRGDIIAVFITTPISTRDPEGIMDEIHSQGGLVILPHPFRYSNFNDRDFEQCDLIETFNARTPNADNQRAARIAADLGKPGIAGPDAHLGCELGLAVNEYDVPADWDWPRILQSEPSRVTSRKTTIRNVRKSQAIKACRRLRPVLLAKSLIRWAQAGPTETVS